MCLASVYGKRDSEEETLILKNVTKVLIDGEDITLYDIIGLPTKIKGVVTEVDLMDSIVKIRQTD